MSIKMFCDKCGKKTKRNYMDNTLNRTLDDFEAKVVISYLGNDSKGEICLNCLLKVINEGTDR